MSNRITDENTPGDPHLHVTVENGELTEVEVSRVFLRGPMTVSVGGKVVGTTNELRTVETLYKKKRNGKQ